MQRNDLGALLLALAVTIALGWGTVYFVRELWPILPPWLSMIVFILLAIIVIGYPIYTLGRWADRSLARRRPPTPPAATQQARDEQQNDD